MQAAALEATMASSTEGFPNFDEKEEGYGWILIIDKFWNTNETPEVQRLQEVEKGLSGRPLRWCRLWKQRNPNATLSNFQLAFLHRYSCFSDALPLIEQSEVSDWELETEDETEIFLKNEVTIGKQQPKLDREDEVVYGQQVEDKRDGMEVGVNINICKLRDRNDELLPPPKPPDTEKTEEETTKKLAELASTTQPPEPPDSVTTAMSVAAATKGRNRRGEMFGVVREIQASRVTWGLRPPLDLPAESVFSPAATKMVEVALMKMLRALHAVIVAAKELPPPKPPYSPASRRGFAGFAWKKKNTVAENLLGGCCVEEERQKTDHKVGRASMDSSQILDPMGQAHITRERNKTYDEGSLFVKLMSPAQNCKVKLNKLKMAIVKSEGPLAEPFVFSIYKPFKWAVSILYFEGNYYFYKDLTLLNETGELATKKDVTALQEHQKTEVKKFMSLWNNDKAFRNDYVKRIFPSLDMHQLSGDGRTRKVLDLIKKGIEIMPNYERLDTLEKLNVNHRFNPMETEGMQLARGSDLDILSIMPTRLSKDTSSCFPIFLQVVSSYTTKPVPIATSIISLISYFWDPSIQCDVIKFSSMLSAMVDYIQPFSYGTTFLATVNDEIRDLRHFMSYILQEQSALNEDCNHERKEISGFGKHIASNMFLPKASLGKEAYAAMFMDQGKSYRILQGLRTNQVMGELISIFRGQESSQGKFGARYDSSFVRRVNNYVAAIFELWDPREHLLSSFKIWDPGGSPKSALWVMLFPHQLEDKIEAMPALISEKKNKKS